MNIFKSMQGKSHIISSLVKKSIYTTGSDHNIAKTMNKVLKGAIPRKKKRSNIEHVPIPYTPETFTKGANEGTRSANSKRVTVLNKLFMKHITDLMATGECSSAFLGRRIEINRVQVFPDYQGVNVFWVATGTENDIVTEKILKENAGNLRHELSQLRIMGKVPKIHFVKDKQFARLMEVDLRLAKADFGEDYVPLDVTQLLKSHPILTTALDSQIKEEIEKLEKQQENTENEEDALPKMPQDVLGLQHDVIMENIKKGLKKSQALHRVVDNSETDDSEPFYNKQQTTNANALEFPNIKVQNEVFRQFLLKRKILRAKANKPEKNLRPELDYLEYEQEKYLNSLFSNESNYFKEMDDYLDEEDMEK